MNVKNMICVGSFMVCAGLFASSTFAQQFVYPKNNQTPEQQKKDEFDCHTWATQQAGYDPIKASQTPPTQVPTGTAQAERGSAVRGAARGAAAGAAIGAIAGDAGKGAAIGATAGGVGGRVRSKNKAQDKQDQQVEQANAAAADQARLAERYNSARAACLDAKGYTVK